MKKLLLLAIDIYQKIPGLHHNRCRHLPTCSNYAKEAIERFGAIKGCFLSIQRVLRCNPFTQAGYDPVPQKEE